MSFAERLRVIEGRLVQSENEKEKLKIALFRLCESMGVNYEMIFKSDTLFDWDKFEIKEDKVKSKEKLPPIAFVTDALEEEKKKVADIYE